MIAYITLVSYWCAVIGIALLTPHVPLLATASAYGKLAVHRSLQQQPATQQSWTHSVLLTPSLYLTNGRCFTAYYALATALNGRLLLDLLVRTRTAAHMARQQRALR